MRHSRVRAEIPSLEADRPPILSSLAIALVCLALGLMLARWTVRPAPPAADAPDRAPDEASSEPETSTPGEPEVAEPPAFPEPPEPSLAPPAALTPAVETPPAAVAPPAAAALEPTVAEAAPTRGSRGGTLRRGRVAYLRCEEGASGAACARDRAIEDAIWAAIEDLPECATAPAAPGQADLVVELGDDGIEIRARDTFGADVVRLDGPATLACVSPALLAAPALTGSSRRVFVSFRFSLEP